MHSFNNPRFSPIPVSGSGTALEVLVAELRIHASYAEKENEALRQEIANLRHEVHELTEALNAEVEEIKQDREAMIRRIALWLAGAIVTVIGSVLGSLVWPVLRAAFQAQGSAG